MISRSTAQKIAQGFVDDFNKTISADKPRCVMLADRECEYEACWMFQFNSEEYVRTGQFRDAWFGLPTLIVDKRDGALYLCSLIHLQRDPAALSEALGRDDFRGLKRAPEHLQPSLARKAPAGGPK